MTTITRPIITNRTGTTPTGRRLTRNQMILRGAGGQDAATTVWLETVAHMKRKFGVDEYWATAVAVAVFEQFQTKPSHWLETYGSARKFACSVAKSRYLDLLGVERGQRGEGRTLVRLPDGGSRKRRTCVPNVRFDETENDWVPVEPVDTGRDFTEDVVTRVDLARAAKDVPQAERRALDSVIIEGRTTVEVGAAEGVAHSTIIKRGAKGGAKIREALGEDYPSPQV